MRIVVVAVLALVALAVIASCSDDKPPISGSCTVNCTPVFTNSGSGPDGDAGSCGFVVLAQTCNDCIRTQCCDFDLTCYDDPSCSALVGCLNGCATDDVTCEEACGGANDAGTGAYGDFVNCVQSTCNTECSATD